MHRHGASPERRDARSSSTEWTVPAPPPSLPGFREPMPDHPTTSSAGLVASRQQTRRRALASTAPLPSSRLVSGGHRPGANPRDRRGHAFLGYVDDTRRFASRAKGWRARLAMRRSGISSGGVDSSAVEAASRHRARSCVRGTRGSLRRRPQGCPPLAAKGFSTDAVEAVNRVIDRSQAGDRAESEPPGRPTAPSMRPAACLAGRWWRNLGVGLARRATDQAAEASGARLHPTRAGVMAAPAPPVPVLAVPGADETGLVAPAEARRRRMRRVEPRASAPKQRAFTRPCAPAASDAGEATGSARRFEGWTLSGRRGPLHLPGRWRGQPPFDPSTRDATRTGAARVVGRSTRDVRRPNPGEPSTCAVTGRCQGSVGFLRNTGGVSACTCRLPGVMSEDAAVDHEVRARDPSRRERTANRRQRRLRRRWWSGRRMRRATPSAMPADPSASIGGETQFARIPLDHSAARVRGHRRLQGAVVAVVERRLQAPDRADVGVRAEGMAPASASSPRRPNVDPSISTTSSFRWPRCATSACVDATMSSVRTPRS